VQQRKSRLVKEGKLQDAGTADAACPSRKELSFAESEISYDVLPEVLQAQSRIDEPNAAKRKEYDLHMFKPQLSALTDEERRRHRTSSSMLGAALGHIPRLSLGGRNRYNFTRESSVGGDLSLAPVSARRQVTPQAVEVATRSFNAGMRALVYGTLLGVATLMVGGTAAIRAFDIGPSENFKDRMQARVEPAAAVVRGWFAPVKTALSTWATADGNGSAAAGGPSELQTRLKNRYNPRISNKKPAFPL